MTNETNETNAVEKIEKTAKGLGLLWKPVGERQFLYRKDYQFEFVDFWNDPIYTIRVWELKNGTGSIKILPVSDFPVDDLKNLGIWDLLSDTKKVELENGVVQIEAKYQAEKIANHEERKAGRKARSEYKDIPKEIPCKKCGEMKTIIPSYVYKTTQAKGITVDEWIEKFVCLKCDPSKRGRKSSGKYDNVPKEIPCSHEGCTFTQKQHPSVTGKQAEMAGKSVEEFVSGWLCKEHRPAKVHHFSKEGREARLAEGKPVKTRQAHQAKEKPIKAVVETNLIQDPKEAVTISKEPVEGFVKGRRGRLPNPAYAMIPKEAICVGCQKSVKLVAQNIIGKAAILKITVDELVKNYKCRSCGGRLTKNSKK